MSEPKVPNRRDFLKKTAIAAATAGLGGCAVTEKRGLGGLKQAVVKAKARRKLGPNDRINVGVIGCGGMGNAHINTLLTLKKEGLIEVVAVCDVFSKRLDAAAKRTGGKPYKVWTDLIADDRVDTVSIATPDHWHAPITITAVEAGKDVYCEKPMTHWQHLDLAKKVVDVVAKHNAVMQVGTQFMSDDVWDLARDNIARLGKPIHVQSTDCRNGPIGCYSPKSNDPAAVPGKTLDWDMWLGTEFTGAPKRAYEPGRFFAFRSYWDYSGGVGTDFFPHILTPWIKVLDLGFPKRAVQSGGQYYWEDGREVADILNMSLDYADGPTVTVLAALATGQNLPWLIRGQKAAFEFAGPSSPLKILPEKRVPDAGKPAEIKGKRRWSLDNHYRDFFDCVKSRKKPRSHEIFGYRVMAALAAGIQSYRTGKAMGFDEKTGKLVAL